METVKSSSSAFPLRGFRFKPCLIISLPSFRFFFFSDSCPLIGAIVLMLVFSYCLYAEWAWFVCTCGTHFLSFDAAQFGGRINGDGEIFLALTTLNPASPWLCCEMVVKLKTLCQAKWWDTLHRRPGTGGQRWLTFLDHSYSPNIYRCIQVLMQIQIKKHFFYCVFSPLIYTCITLSTKKQYNKTKQTIKKKKTIKLLLLTINICLLLFSLNHLYFLLLCGLICIYRMLIQHIIN